MLNFKNFKPKPGEKDAFQKLADEAIEWGQLLRERLKDIPGNHLSIGKSFMEQGLFKEASYRFRIVKWMRPKHAEATALLAECYAKYGELEKAKQAFAELKTIDPASAHIARVKQIILEAASPKPKPSETKEETNSSSEPPHDTTTTS